MDNLDFFAPPLSGDDLVRKFYVDYRPTSAWREGAPLEFYVPGSMPYLVSLKDTRMCLTWSVVNSDASKAKVGSTQSSDCVAAPINLSHQTMWKEVDIQLQHHTTRSTGNM